MSNHHFKSTGHPFYSCQSEGGYTYQAVLETMRRANEVSIGHGYSLEECRSCGDKVMMNYENYEEWKEAGVHQKGFFCDLPACQSEQKLVRRMR